MRVGGKAQGVVTEGRMLERIVVREGECRYRGWVVAVGLRAREMQAWCRRRGVCESVIEGAA